MPVAELATRVNLSQTPCWKRVQRLKETGVIRAVPLYDVSSSFAMEQIKYSTALPVRSPLGVTGN
ncbi:MAG: Transcriptional regulator, AsnC family [Candidatus Burkholderia crenata]|nr:MAG: Transcriptional regulator, AsnC family [Candidatus Burkholderia crenata]